MYISTSFTNLTVSTIIIAAKKAQNKTNKSPITSPTSPSRDKKSIPKTANPTEIHNFFFICVLNTIKLKNGTKTAYKPVINPAFPAVVVIKPNV